MKAEQMTDLDRKKRNRRRQDLIVRQREELASLRADLVLLARAVLPDHPKGGFFNPLTATHALDRARAILDARSSAET